ncbi:hypothetical protein EB796_018146 [Bugula neritina]|uniref:Uncharacterized protein n=1 Tax=Bugula neritina TaxID=10212 RepID=A0A7J7JBB7_BUGNE|nr:hypothetical protein EB796_018146 [Bugula neritina]
MATSVCIKAFLLQFLSYNRRVIVTEPVTMSHDRLICSMIGHTSFVLIPAASWELSATELHTIEYSAVNYTSHPWLKDIEYHVALNNQPGDCIYVPRNWYAQTSHTDPLSSTVEFTWKGEMKKVSKWSCGDQDLSSQHELGSFSKYFSAARPQRDTVKDALIHYFVFYLGDNLLSSFTSKQFIRKQKRDDKIFGKLIDWNSEVEEISTELFEMLDRNSDGRFSLADVQNISSEARDAFVSQIQDRLQDFGAIIDKQQKFNKEKLKSSKQDSPKKPTSKQPKTSDSSTKSKKEPKKQKEEL